MTWQSIATALIQSFEGCKLEPYQDVGGVWTCGWGSTGVDVVSGEPWTQDYADQRFQTDLERFGQAVDEIIHVTLNDNRKAALVSFAYNLGDNALEHSTLALRINGGDMIGAAEQFTAWCHVNGAVVEGLLRRRIAEQSLFNTP